MIVKVPIVTDHRSVAEMNSVKEKTYMGVSKTTNGQNERKKTNRIKSTHNPEPERHYGILQNLSHNFAPSHHKF